MAKEPTKAQREKLVKLYEDAITDIIAGDDVPADLRGAIEAKVAELNGDTKPPVNETRKPDAVHKVALDDFSVAIDVFMVGTTPTAFATVIEDEDGAEQGDTGGSLFEAPPVDVDRMKADVESEKARIDSEAAAAKAKAGGDAASKEKARVAALQADKAKAHAESLAKVESTDPDGTLNVRFNLGDHLIYAEIEAALEAYKPAIAAYGDGETTKAEFDQALGAVDAPVIEKTTFFHSLVLKVDGRNGIVHVMLDAVRAGGKVYARAQVAF